MMCPFRLFLLLLLLASPATAQDEAASGDGWPASFEAVALTATADGAAQHAYFRATTAETPQPLVVHLHSWSADWQQLDRPLVDSVAARNWNYIHPDFRGPNDHPEACCSDLVVSDIEDAIGYAQAHANVDPTRIYLLGGSGGGYATLCFFMRSALTAAAYGAWVPISNLEAWHAESAARGNRYAEMIRSCTASPDTLLGVAEARRRSPFYLPTPAEKLRTATLSLYAGVRDGIEGSVPITHSLLFYNKVLDDLGVAAPSARVQPDDLIHLLTAYAAPDGPQGRLGDRDVLYRRRFGNVRVVIFDGAHEMLQSVALDELEAR